MIQQIKISIISLLLISAFIQSKAVRQITINDAVEKELVELQIRGTDWSESEDYGDASVVLKIKNISSEVLSVQVPIGQRFMTVDKEYQDMLVTRELILAIAPGKSRSGGLLAMCTQVSNMGPGSGTDFTVGPMAEGELLEVARHLNKKGFSDKGEGQQAVWCISDGKPLSYIYDNDLRKWMADLTGREYTEAARGINRPQRIATFTVKGKVEFALNEPGTVTIAMFDSTGAEVKTIHSAEKPRGRHWHSWRFTYKEGTYTMKLIVNGVVKGEDIYELKRS